MFAHGHSTSPSPMLYNGDMTARLLSVYKPYAKMLTILTSMLPSIPKWTMWFVARRLATRRMRVPEPLLLIAKGRMDLRLRKCRQMLTLCGSNCCSDVL